MCLIIERKPHFEIPFDKFKTAILNNPDGYGLAYPDGGRLKVLRSPDKPDPEKLYRIINEELKEVPLTVHLRYTTAGKTNLRNAHPFPILEKNTDGVDLRMAHNGTLHKYKQQAIKDESDTRAFVRNFVRPLFKRMSKGFEPEEFLTDPFIKKVLEDQLTSSSVLSFIDSNGNTLTCNETGNGGKREDGWWYSNTYSFNDKHREPVTPVTPVTYIGSSYTGGTNGFEDCNVTKFSTKYKMKSILDVAIFSDDTISKICKEPTEAELLIKELILTVTDQQKKLSIKGNKNVH